MKIKFHCTTCTQGRAPGPDTEVELIPVDSGLYEVRCAKAHVNPCVLQQMRFEVLFDIGVHAIRDGYNREAISSFAAALERFLEFYTRMVFRERKIDSRLLANTWKAVNNQSERQLGAYLFLYGINEAEQAKYLAQDMIELRNAVIHKGRLASREEALKFGNAVIKLINPTVRKFKERCPELLLEAVQEYQQSVLANSKQPVYAGNCINTTISLAYALSVPDCEDIGRLPLLAVHSQ
jgi:hypothetical protein